MTLPDGYLVMLILAWAETFTMNIFDLSAPDTALGNEGVLIEYDVPGNLDWVFARW